MITLVLILGGALIVVFILVWIAATGSIDGYSSLRSNLELIAKESNGRVAGSSIKTLSASFKYNGEPIAVKTYLSAVGKYVEYYRLSIRNENTGAHVRVSLEVATSMEGIREILDQLAGPQPSIENVEAR